MLHALRTPKVPFIQSNATFAMFVITTLGIIVGSVLPFTSFGAELGLMPLPGNYWLWLFATVIAYLALVTAVKKIYIRQFQKTIINEKAGSCFCSFWTSGVLNYVFVWKRINV